MKFTCERCGKKYATAEDPAPGRVYKLRCKACGHLIVVKASASGGTPAEPPPLGLDLGTPEPSHGGGASGSPNAFDATTEVSTAALRSQDLETTPSPGDSGYVDLFSDVASGATELPQKPKDDPFLAAARASLPDGYGSGSNAPDPFAGLRDDISATSAPEPPSRPHPPIPKVPVIPKPKQEKTAIPLVLIGAGVAVMVGILAFVMLSSGKKETPRPPAPPAAAIPAPSIPAPAPSIPAPAPVAAAAPAETAQPAPPTPAPPPQAAPNEADAEKRARAEQKRKEREEAKARAGQARAEREARDREAKAQARAEREAKDRAAREAKAQRERDARAERDRAAAEAKERARLSRQASAAESASAEPEGGLTQKQIEGVLRSTKTAFDGCIQAARGGGATLDGRRVMLRLNIQTNGAVTYPTLDDVTLNGTDLGACLKSAARLMVFPKFKGDTMHVEVPLVMR